MPHLASLLYPPPPAPHVFLWAQGFTLQSRQIWNSLCSLGWPQTHGTLFASTFLVLGFQQRTTSPCSSGSFTLILGELWRLLRLLIKLKDGGIQEGQRGSYPGSLGGGPCGKQHLCSRTLSCPQAPLESEPDKEGHRLE